MKRGLWWLAAALGATAGAPSTAAAQTVQDTLGRQVYEARCAGCHDQAKDRTPARSQWAPRTRAELHALLRHGVMREAAAGLQEQEFEALLDHLEAPQALARARRDKPCEPGPGRGAGSSWQGWGNGLGQMRYQPQAGLDRESVARLKPRWVYAIEASATVGQASVWDGIIYLGTEAGQIIALDLESGCTHWRRDSGAPIRTSFVRGQGRASSDPVLLFFGDDQGYLQAIDARSGEMRWRRRMDAHVASRITGAPVFHEGRIYVTVSSGEEGWAQRASYPCCSFRGSVAALDAASGTLLWQTFTIAEPARPHRRSSTGTPLQGPAGAAVWMPATLDPARGLLYVGTGNSYTEVPVPTSNAILAFDLDSGQLRWSQQMLAGDHYVMPCLQSPERAGQGNCPQAVGPDHDFGAALILSARPDGRPLLLAGQKSGQVHALDPAKAGQLVWSRRIGAGSALGGIQWGMAADGDTVYAALADPYPNGLSRPEPGLAALRMRDGELLWKVAAPPARCAWGASRCRRSFSSAVTAMTGAVFVGAADGHLHAYDSRNGQALWSYDTGAIALTPVNGGQVTGGSIDNGGPIIVDGKLVVLSGYGRQLAKAGNALIVFSVDGR